MATQILPLFASKSTIEVRVFLLGERIDLRTLELGDRLGIAPLTISVGSRGCAVLFRYGVVVLFDVTAAEEEAFLASLEPLISEPFKRREQDRVDVSVDSIRDERVEGGIIQLREYSLERLQVVADVLAKSVVLAYYEASIAEAFDRIEPLAAELQRTGRGRRKAKDLLRHIGGALLVEHKMVGRVEVGEKPEILWERPELERLYLRLEDEYELRERHLALERKLGLIAKTAETLLDLLQHGRSLRVEWYIVILIVVEIGLTLYELFMKGSIG